MLYICEHRENLSVLLLSKCMDVVEILRKAEGTRLSAIKEAASYSRAQRPLPDCSAVDNGSMVMPRQPVKIAHHERRQDKG